MKIIKLFIGFAIFAAILFVAGSICQAEENEICGVSAERLTVYKERIAQYAPMIQSTLKNYNVDEQFIWLAMMESGGINKAESSRGALGLWQLTSGTAKRHGLNPILRIDPASSTDVAAKYLSKLLVDFDGDVWKAIVGYNMGGSNYKKRGKPTWEAKHLANTVTCLMREHPYVYLDE